MSASPSASAASWTWHDSVERRVAGSAPSSVVSSTVPSVGAASSSVVQAGAEAGEVALPSLALRVQQSAWPFLAPMLLGTTAAAVVLAAEPATVQATTYDSESWSASVDGVASVQVKEVAASPEGGVRLAAGALGAELRMVTAWPDELDSGPPAAVPSLGVRVHAMVMPLSVIAAGRVQLPPVSLGEPSRTSMNWLVLWSASPSASDQPAQAQVTSWVVSPAAGRRSRPVHDGALSAMVTWQVPGGPSTQPSLATTVSSKVSSRVVSAAGRVSLEATMSDEGSLRHW
ncbi:MAG: hypothetical protein U1F43_31545 [Myxococcota bacterium]